MATTKLDRRGFLLLAGAAAAGCSGLLDGNTGGWQDGGRVRVDGPLPGDRGLDAGGPPATDGAAFDTATDRAVVDAAPAAKSCTPPTLPINDGGNNPAQNPAITPSDGQVISDTHFRNWTADGVWPSAGAAAVVNASKIDPNIQWTIKNCRFSKCHGETVTGRYGMTVQDAWFEEISNIGIMGNGPMSLYGRNLCFNRVSHDHPEIIWNHAGAIKVTGGSATAEPWVDIDGLWIYDCWNGPYFWADWGPVIRKLWNTTMHGGCRWRGLMLELAAGLPSWTPSLKNVEIAHTNYEPAIGQPWSNVFNGAFLLMNSRDITAENLTIITPENASAFAMQDDAGRHSHSYIAPAVVRDLDFNGGLIVLRGANSTLERHWWQTPGLDNVGSNIKIRNFEVWVEAGTQSAADARCASPFASGLNIIPKTAAQIDADLVKRGLSHLLESNSAH